MAKSTLTRRCVLAGAAVFGAAPFIVRPSRAADHKFAQYHNQAPESALNKRLIEMWAAIRAETNGRVETQVFAENNKLPGGDPAVLKMLIAGEVQFFTLMGGILGNVVAVAEVQQVPFAFRAPADAHRAVDGALGAYLREEMAAKGIYGFPVSAFDNGMRQVSSSTRPITKPEDLAGLKIRIPAGQMAADTFKAFGAEPIVINANGIYDGLKSGKVEAQENPLAIVELFKLYEVQKYVSMTNHMWSAFNLMAHLPTWLGLPDDLKAVVERNATKYVRLQREDQAKLNDDLRGRLAGRGLVFNDVEQAPFRAKMSGVYANWKEKLGTKCWSLLEAETGKLA
jgi:tripartite ATP-independent transporter DctP family solute receptor